MIAPPVDLGAVLRWMFPRLTECALTVADPATNCLGFAVEQPGWWLDPQQETVPALLEVLATAGYVPCERLDPSRRGAHIAVFALHGQPSHVARELPSGRWASQVGAIAVVEHDDLEALEGGVYGDVAVILQRRGEP